MISILGDNNEVTYIENSESGIQFRGPINEQGNHIYCVIPAHDWYSAWDKLKQIKTESDIVQWSYIDKKNETMLLCESFVAFEKNTHQIKFTCKVVQLLHAKSFKDIKEFSENKGS